jgi:hypothetical protein
MTRSSLDVLAQAVDGDAAGLPDNPHGDGSGIDVAHALELGWASLPPALAAQLTPPADIPGDLDAGPSDVLAAVLVHPPEPVVDVAIDERWGAGSDDADVPASDHDPSAGIDAVPAWLTHDLDDDLMSASDPHHTAPAHDPVVTDDADDDDPDDDADPWDEALI